MLIRPKLRNGKFAASFADLMMGAMGTMIVLLSFLTITLVKGQGSFNSIEERMMPAGLRQYEAMPITRLKIVVCQKNNTHMPIGIRLTSAKIADHLTISHSISDACHYQNMLFAKGLGAGKTKLYLSEDISTKVELSIHLMVGGYALPLKTLSVRGHKMDEIVLIDLSHRDVIVEV